MYAKCGALAKAQQVLEELPSRDVITWSSLIAGYVQEGQGEKALHCFEQMQREGLSPNAMTFACILQACGSIGADEKGEKVHDVIDCLEIMLCFMLLLWTCMPSGAFEKASRVLEDLPSSDVVPWNALMAGYVQYGQCEKALSCFERMQCKGLSPKTVCVLHACSHLGLVDDGHMYFLNMSTRYGVKPAAEHYACMVDLFGRAGHLVKAVGVIQEMPSSNSTTVWSGCLPEMGGCECWEMGI
jgi:pentatricopeptide repeat protein